MSTSQSETLVPFQRDLLEYGDGSDDEESDTISTNPEIATKQLLQLFKDLGGIFKYHSRKEWGTSKFYACHRQSGSNAMHKAVFYIEDHNNRASSKGFISTNHNNRVYTYSIRAISSGFIKFGNCTNRFIYNPLGKDIERVKMIMKMLLLSKLKL